MTTQSEPEETMEPTSDVILDDGIAITPTASPVKADFFDRSVSWIVAVAILLVGVGVAFAMIVSIMGMSGSVKHDLRSPLDTHDAGGVCHNMAFSVTEFNQDSFDEYQAKHPDEEPYEVLCSIPFENNTNYR